MWWEEPSIWQAVGGAEVEARPTECAALRAVYLEAYAVRVLRMPRRVIAALKDEGTFIAWLELYFETRELQGSPWNTEKRRIPPRRVGRPKKLAPASV